MADCEVERGKSHCTNSVRGEVDRVEERVVRRYVGVKGARRERKEVYAGEDVRADGEGKAGQVEVIWIVEGDWVLVPKVCWAGEEVRRVWRVGMEGGEMEVVGLMVVIVMTGIFADVGMMMRQIELGNIFQLPHHPSTTIYSHPSAPVGRGHVLSPSAKRGRLVIVIFKPPTPRNTFPWPSPLPSQIPSILPFSPTYPHHLATSSNPSPAAVQAPSNRNNIRTRYTDNYLRNPIHFQNMKPAVQYMRTYVAWAFDTCGFDGA